MEGRTVIPDIGNPERDAEAAMLIPARSAWGLSPATLAMADIKKLTEIRGSFPGIPTEPPAWYGKKPGRHVAPLTDEWAIAAMQAKFQPDGSILRTLTPPKPGGWRIGYVVIGIAFIVALGAVFTYPLWR